MIAYFYCVWWWEVAIRCAVAGPYLMACPAQINREGDTTE